MSIDYETIPESTREGLNRYVEYGVPTGDFLEAVLSNNLREAFGRADEHNQRAMPAIVSYCYHKLPAECWGSQGKYDAWLARAAQRRREAVAS